MARLRVLILTGKRKVWCYMTASEEITGFDSRRNAFIGPFGDEQTPVAMRKNGGCTGSGANSEKLWSYEEMESQFRNLWVIE